ncbi:surface-anchored protein [Bifidobacterium hapali]|uniref:Surface-anchored protein n=1 Tax=Bifidobacterium hapali TaxID=1630172 RepID=A0A261G2H9_9BIFI|nr:hypothetical protein [Bifidobacterium hapali]OZG65196.1 surface-anchored protein [Bifidobacterium hapali]
MADMREDMRHGMRAHTHADMRADTRQDDRDHGHSAAHMGILSSALLSVPRRRSFMVIVLCAVMCVAVCVMSLAVPQAFAADADQPIGSLTIDAVWDRDADDKRALAGDSYAIVRVASATLDPDGKPSAFHTLPDFARFIDDWDGLTSSALNAAAKRMDALAADRGLYVERGVTDARGRVQFADLAAGVYLVSRVAVADANTRYTCDPFLVSVPDTEDAVSFGTFDVTVEPKFADAGVPDEPGVTPGPGVKPGPGSTANTGADVVPAIVLAMMCAAVGIAGVVTSRWRRDE